MGVYHFIQDLIVEGKDAWFVKDKEPGRFAINWLKATERYANDYKPGNKNKKSRNPSNNLWSALLYKRYKDNGAKEYKESQKKDEGGNIVERQFQLPAKIFESLFGSDDGRQEDTGGTSSKACKSSPETANASTSDTSGYEDTIDTSCDDTDSKSEEESDISTPFEIFGIPKEELKKLSYDQGVVEGIFPKAGSTEGGLLFIITFKEQLPEDDTSEMYEAEFDGVGVVPLEKFENSALSGLTPSSSKTGLVKVTVRTQAGRLLLVTSFLYVDRSTLDVLKQLVKDPALQSLLFAVWSQEQSICGSNSVDALSQGPSTMQDQGSSIKTEHAQALKVLQLLALTAGQTNARQFIQMLFRTSFGKTMPDANKVPTPLLKDVSMASSHDDIAQNLQDVNTRLTKEGSSEVPVTAANDIQKQSSVTDDETSLESGQCKRARDDNQGDYFADIETSSSGSFELEAGGSDSDDDDGSSSGPASKRRRISWSLQEEEYPLTGRKKGKGFKRPILRRGIVSEPSATVVADVNKALIKSNSGGDKNETALMMMSPSVNWAEFLTPAPMTIGLLGHLLLIAAEKDFSLENQRPEKGFQFIEHPESFRACLVQVSNTGWRAFNEAHKNMDAIRLYSAQVPDQVKKVVHTLIKGSDEDVKDFLPIELGKIERNSTECLRLAQSVEAKFELMMDLTRELLEVSSAARGYYEKKQEEVKLKREIALAKEKLAREKIYAAKEQQEKMEKGVRDAKRSWERVIDSLPSGCDILGMEIAETIVHGFVEMVQVAKDAIASVARSAAQAGGPGQRAGVEQSSTGGQPVPTFKGAEELKIYTSQLSEVLSSASKRTKDDADPKAEEPIGKKLQKMKIFMQELRKDLTGKEESSIDPEMQELLENGLEICKEGEKIANGLTFSPDKLKGIAAKAAELQKKVMKFCIKARAKTGGNPFTTKAPRQAQTMTSSVGSTSKSAAKTAVESAQFKIAESRGLLERQENRYDQTCKDLEASNEELSKVLESLAELSPEKLADFDQIRDTLMRGIKALAEVREQWQKLVQFFQFITNIIKVCQNESLKSFVDYTKVGQKRVLANGYASSDFMRDLIYEQVSQANTTSYVVWSISNTYVEISNKYLMGRLANLGQLIALDPAKERHTIELKKTELMESSKEAQEAIRTLVEKAKDDFHAKVEKRIKQIENELLKVLPAEDPAKIKEIKDTVSLAIKEADNRFNEDDF